MNEVYLEKYGIIVFENGDVIGRNGGKLVGEIDKDGYIRYSVSFYLDGKRIRKHRIAHQIVAEAFLPNFNDFPVVNHLDGNKLNNHYTNLEMTTVQGNTIHAVENNLFKCRGEYSHLNIHSEELVSKIMIELKSVKRCPNGNIKPGELIRIADKLGTTRFIVKNYSRSRETWKHLKISNATTISEESTS